METLYESLLSDTELIGRQFMGAVAELADTEGPAFVYVTADYTITSSNPVRTGFLSDGSELVRRLCGRIDDGDDPCVSDVQTGCLVGTQLQTEQGHCGYFFAFLPGYSNEILQANMELAEVILAQAQLIWRLIEKNNKLHHMQLVHLTKRSAILGTGIGERCGA